ncbi:PQQ-dependent sugar dehydrogenase [Winogradskyella sediminis]|uniref:Glucose/arabinose dehydrogenase, beta-propeller fold n=1 Tax=Winogradskyella sediminis TaxID=1382466 RepID=A0A1H1VP33_9FLAO|nr:PQQ-dependent sugar dehydrogenase [Winogradskyella sediminis]REG87787.1 glucose/arabinose dehydrogenase [Winogradskyella sediminis]SDS86637.1 Glucose/arabinose dehydrogenase, beta-propeller fold [Winogradskyella sediminis]
MTMKNIIIGLILTSTLACAQDKNPKNIENTHEVIVSDINIPWGFTFLPDESMLITEKSGELIHFKNGKKTSIRGLPDIYPRGQGGLLDIIIHPDYDKNGWIYLSYSSSEGEGSGGNTTIARAQLENNSLTNLQVLYKAIPNTTKGQHFGSRLIFDDAGYLYFSIGERGNRDENPQDITRDGGKIYRLNDDGSIPSDNPFINNSEAKTAIYSYGHRNPQGMTLHPETREIWTHEHGPKGGDEINIIEAGKNYGWPVISYGINYIGTKFTDITKKEGMEQPLHYWDPSIAPSGMAFINSDKYGDWDGNLLIGSLKFQYLDMCTLQNNKVVKEERLLDGLGRVRSVEQGPDGFIYVGIENLGIVKLIRK